MFTLTIETDNAAFEDGMPTNELRRIMGRICDRISTEGWHPRKVDGGKVMDVNGNTVGTWSYTPSEG